MLQLVSVKDYFGRFDVFIPFKSYMSGTIFKCHKIFGAVIIFNFIKMMNHFKRRNAFTLLTAGFKHKKSALSLSIYSIAFLLLFVNITHAQESQNRIYIFDSFEGGLASKPSNIGLNKKFATIAENVRFNKELKSLVKRSEVLKFGTADTSESITGMHRFYTKAGTKTLLVSHGDEIEAGTDSSGAFTALPTAASASITLTSDLKWKFLTWHDIWIGCDGQTAPLKGNATDVTFLGSAYAEDKGSGGGPDGAYTYKISFYTTTYEVIFNVASNLVTVSDNDITLTMIPIGPDTFLGEDIIGRKVYRSDTGGAGTFNLVPNTGTIADNTTVTIDDTETDVAVDAEAAYPTVNNTTIFAWTPPKGKLSLINNNRLFFANDPNTATDTGPSTIYYSKDGSHDLFENADNYFNIRKNDGDETTGIFNLLGVLTISKTNTWQKLYTDGDDPAEDWEISDPFSFVGNAAPYSGINTPLGIIYLSRDGPGLYIFNGQHSKLVSDIVTPTITDISPSDIAKTWGEFHDNIYYLTYASNASGSSANNRVLGYDIVSQSYFIDTLNINAFCVFDSGTDEGTLVAGSSLDGTVYTYKPSSQEIIHKIHADFTGTFDDARFIPNNPPVTGNPNSPIIEMSWDTDVDNTAGTVDAASGDVNRPDTGGTYISQVLNTAGAATYDLIMWNEVLASGATTDVTLAVRSGATAAACAVAAFGSEVSNSSGSDISANTANEFTQYRITLSTDDIDYTSTVVRVGPYNIRLTYNLAGTSVEGSIPLHWQGGFTDMGHPGYRKSLKKVYALYDSASTGTLTLKFTNWEGDNDTFDIDLATYPTTYEEFFTGGKLVGEKFSLDITEDSLNPLTVKPFILVVYEVEPIELRFE